MRTLIILLVLAGLGLWWMRHENSTIARSFEKANRIAGEQKTQITMLKNQLRVAAGIADGNERAQVDLRDKLAAAEALAGRRSNTITRLLNENKALREWYDTALPDDVIRLHERPAFDTTADYLQWLSESGAVQTPGQSAPH
ncbi:Rz-like lysis system protein LysB [Cedecea sp.]|jgi:LysB family phage lysis regulatory protein|uniref:Rz-like lysis system protein LysB n=1 Tax=Cedecea sp. TaxID=1970739 RepID=UPI002F4064FC